MEGKKRRPPMVHKRCRDCGKRVLIHKQFAKVFSSVICYECSPAAIHDINMKFDPEYAEQHGDS